MYTPYRERHLRRTPVVNDDWAETSSFSVDQNVQYIHLVVVTGETRHHCKDRLAANVFGGNLINPIKGDGVTVLECEEFSLEGDRIFLA